MTDFLWQPVICCTPALSPTDRGGCLDGFDSSFKHLLGQAKVGGATVHDALVVVVLGQGRGGQKSREPFLMPGSGIGRVTPTAWGPSWLRTS